MTHCAGTEGGVHSKCTAQTKLRVTEFGLDMAYVSNNPIIIQYLNQTNNIQVSDSDSFSF